MKIDHFPICNYTIKMPIALIVFGFLISVYILGTFAFLFLHTSTLPYMGDKALYKDIPDLRPEDFAKAEQNLLVDAENYVLRLSVLKYIFNMQGKYDQPEIGIEHAKWIIKNKTEYIGAVIVQSPFLLAKDRKDISKNLMLEAISKNNESNEILRSATHFLTNLNTKFALECARKLFKKESLNPACIEQIAILEKFLVVKDEETPEDFIPSWLAYKQLISWPWDEYDFHKLEKLKNNFGHFLWPYPISFLFLYIKGRISYGLTGYNRDYFELTQAGLAALDAHQFSFAKKIGAQLKNRLDEYQASCHYPPLMIGTFYFLMRIALLDGNVADAKYFLKRREAFPIESQFEFFGETQKAANSLISAGHHQLAYDHFETLTKNVTKNETIRKYLDIISSGQLLTNETLFGKKT